MSFILSRSQLEQCGEQVRELRFPSVASLYGIHDDRSRPADFLGTGTFIRHHNDVFVLTAYHVVRRSLKYAHVFHEVGGNGENMVPFRSGWTGFKEVSGDLALWGCFAEFFESSDRQPWPIVEPFGNTDAADDAFFIASGWPSEQAVALPHVREYRTTLHTVMGKTVVCDGISVDEFAFNCANNIGYEGMSGSAVWNLNLHVVQKAGDWAPEISTFAGTVVRWDKENGLIIATRAETVKTFLTGAIERLRDQWKAVGTV